MGAGMGLVMAPASTIIMETVPAAQAGAGSAVNDTVREVGGALGIAVVGSVVAARYAHSLSGVLALHHAAGSGHAHGYRVDRRGGRGGRPHRRDRRRRARDGCARRIYERNELWHEGGGGGGSSRGVRLPAYSSPAGVCGVVQLSSCRKLSARSLDGHVHDHRRERDTSRRPQGYVDLRVTWRTCREVQSLK